MHLVYRAMEAEPIPTTLPSSLIPPSKKKRTAGALPGAVAVLPALSGFPAGSAALKDSLRSTPPLGGTTLLSNSTVTLSPKHSFKSSAPVRFFTEVIIWKQAKWLHHGTYKIVIIICENALIGQ